MTAKDFIEKFHDSVFHHSEELFSAIRDSTCILERSPDEVTPLACSHFLGIYRRRANHLKQISTPHAQSLLADCEAFLTELEKNPDEHCGLWSFTMNPYYNFWVFVGMKSNRILGCIRATDARKMDEESRKKLWGHK